MDTHTTVTGQQAIARVSELIAAGDDQAALRYGEEIAPSLIGHISLDELTVLGDLLSSAERAVALARMDEE